MTAFQYGNQDDHIGWDSDRGPNSQNFLWFNPSGKFDVTRFLQMIFFSCSVSQSAIIVIKMKKIVNTTEIKLLAMKNSRNGNVFAKYG